MVTLYISGPKDKGRGVYQLTTKEGKILSEARCSNALFARFDLIDKHPHVKKHLVDIYGEYETIFI